MTSQAATLLPIVFLLHLAEEWFGGLSAWTLLGLVQRLIRGVAWPKRRATYTRYDGLGTLLAGHRDRLAAVHPDECYRAEVVVHPALTNDLREFRLVRCPDPWPYFFSRIPLNVRHFS